MDTTTHGPSLDGVSATGFAPYGGIDEIDLIALGHAPGGARAARQRAPRDIDLRDLLPRQREVRVLAQTASLLPGESVTVASNAPMDGLLDEVYLEVPGFCMFEYREQGPDVWRVEITRVNC
ncbi:DUF2249 domain-containing protein [Demequina sp. B12]|uniref:DUF2249 domain-containing protein n=1 Tax=Demequina sp. B12 TaxID=2992757 RepID=UPI00237A8815|nr:DUF2249 domain-containing protein [Demequina sp. B12]MDE0572929.1 DUF2249 domain-containing protein [Demequina sp. B12]